MSNVTVPKKVNGGAVRIVALFTVIISVVGAITGSTWLVGFLGVDFAVRGVLNPRWSPLGGPARLLQPYSPFKGTPIFFAPKRFAARIGLALSAVGAILLGVGLPLIGGVILGILGFFAFLEGGFNYCVGCKIYGILIRGGVIPQENCPDCA